MTIPVAFAEVVALAERLGVKGIHELPGCWEHQVDALWWIAVNGHGRPVETSDGLELTPFSMAVKCNGWPAGIIDLNGGIIAAGEGANEDAFIEALRDAP